MSEHDATTETTTEPTIDAAAEATTTEAARPARRRVDVLSLLVGLLYVAVAVASLVGIGPSAFRLLAADLLLPGLLVLAGLLILASLRGGGRRA